MKRLVRRLIALLLLPSLTACGNSTSPAQLTPLPQIERRLLTATSTGRPALEGESAAPSESVLPLRELLFVRPEGSKGRLVAYDMSDGRERFALPAGMVSAYGRHYYAAAPDGTSTILDAYDPDTGRFERRFYRSGSWALSGVSALGRWMALTRVPSESEKRAWTEADQWKTDIQIVDGETGETAHILSLDGNFEVETISAGGDSLFLVQHLPAVNPEQYLIRLYDLSQEALQVDPLRAKGADEVMTGLAWDGLASPEGRWLLTLYLNTRRNVAFIHTLDLRDKYPVCIDLPSGSGDFNQLKHYTLALSPDGRKVYAANAVLGVLAEVSLDERRVTHTTTFDTHRLKTDPRIPSSRSVVSKDGRMLYFSSWQAVWAYDTQSKKVSGPYRLLTQIVGLGLSDDGSRLYAASVDGSLAVFDTASGNALSFPLAVEASRTSGE